MNETKSTLEQTLEYVGQKDGNTIKFATGNRHPVLECHGKGCTQVFIKNALSITQPNAQKVSAIHDNGQIERENGNSFTPLPDSIYKIVTYDSQSNDVLKIHTNSSPREEFFLFLESDSPVRSNDLQDLLSPTLQELTRRSEPQMVPTNTETTPLNPQPILVAN